MDTGNKIARIISDIFVPPTFVVLSFIYLAFLLETTSDQKYLIIGTAVLFGLILPVVFFIILRMKRKINDNDAFIKEQRTIPYSAGVVFCAIAIIVLSIFNNPFPIVTYFWVIYIISMIGMLIINYKWKISAHAIGSSILLGLLLFGNSILFLYHLILVIVICWARLRLKMHTKSQIIAGVLYGFLLTYIQLNIYTGFL